MEGLSRNGTVPIFVRDTPSMTSPSLDPPGTINILLGIEG